MRVMRKWTLLGGLGACLGVALLVESFATRAPDDVPPRRLVVRLGGDGPSFEADPRRPDRDAALAKEHGAGAGRPPSAPLEAEAPERPRGETAREHKLISGETLGDVAERYLGSARRWKEIADLNGITDPNRILAGTLLRLPPR